MIGGLRGRLLSAAFAGELLPQMRRAADPSAQVRRALEQWADRVDATLGPASSTRAVADVCVVPLLRALEYQAVESRAVAGGLLYHTKSEGRPGPDVLVVGWNEPLGHAWRAAIHRAIAIDGRWSFCCNGASLRVVDGRRTWSRDYLELELASLAQDAGTLCLAWSLLRGSSLTADSPLLDEVVELSARHGSDICRALGTGVLEALEVLLGALSTSPRQRRQRPAVHLAFEHSVTMLYRLLFLLFAEARGLVPMWHPIYRDHYSLDGMVAALLQGKPSRGLWESIRAISRLAQTGCVAGDLKVNAFNGRLFAPGSTAAFDGTPLPDAVTATALAAVSTRATPGGSRERILFRDLDVEQLGAVYERLLDHEPSSATGELKRTRDVRKSSGTFYTPRPITAALVRQTLEPLVRGRPAQEILDLRILDPAMGSGAFLVAACRYLAAQAEDALVRDGQWHAGDVSPEDRLSLRRQIALRCLYGVDSNPVAVHLARLSLWLTTLARDKPLSFLDHRLVAGDSLLGAGPRDLFHRPLTTAGSGLVAARSLPLFNDLEVEGVLEHAIRTRESLAHEADDTVEIVHGKERALAALYGADAHLARWTRLADLWCAGWFWTEGRPPDRALLSSLSDAILTGRCSLPPATVQPRLAHAHSVAAARRFLHWPLAFPEVFADAHGRARPGAGFDAIVGNPPWDMVRGDSGADAVRGQRREGAKQVTSFVRESGVYRIATTAHVNCYQLFLERALQLARAGGRIGLVLPAGVVSDTGSASLRRHLFEHADVEAIAGFHNRSAIFPIHRSVKFVLLTATAGRPTRTTSCRFGLTSAEELESDTPRAAPIVLSRQLLSRLSGPDDLGIPELATQLDLLIVERVSTQVPRLASADGWNARFGRELNASDDRALFRSRTGAPQARPVVEGKHLDPFRVNLGNCPLELKPLANVRGKVTERPRIAYREVASATNRLTLIAAVIPSHAVTTHTAFCLKTELTEEAMLVLTALLNSFVANYLIRLRVSTHVTAALMSRLPVPFLEAGDPHFDTLVALSGLLADSSEVTETMPEYAQAQAIAARLYGLERHEFEHVLGTFPLVRHEARAESLAAFDELRFYAVHGKDVHLHGPQRHRDTEGLS